MELRIKIYRNEDSSIIVNWVFDYQEEGDLQKNIELATHEARKLHAKPFGFSISICKA